MKTGNLQFVKQMNKAIVFNRISELEPLSRADIAQNTGLNKGTVSSLVSELLEDSLVYESGPGESSGGRRPVLLHFNRRAGFSIGIDIGVNYLLGVVSDLVGTIYKKEIISHEHTDFESIAALLRGMIGELIQSAPESPYGIIGIGIGVPGVVTNSSEVLITPNLGWERMDLKKAVEQWFNIPVIIENEANAGAYGEMLYGAGKNVNDLIYLSAGIGIGTGIIIDGNLYRGTSGFSGEMGHITIDMNGRKCSCGNYGCLELYASENALLSEAKNGLSTLNASELKDLTFEALIEQAEQHNPEVRSLFDKIGTFLGIGIVSIINSFNPRKIIIGNRLAQASQWLEPSIQRLVKERALSHNEDNVDICFSELSSLSSALGASAFVNESFIEGLFKTE
ncbi:ROK family transcriptional regulator [Pullulanibacillus sp. KACC 23026]|uniref:ROK family transcriptional regulator n=1 Tax=Pullulanibacillus sp. KACC 23026 TaxID=3028315 RepID=UPI0023AEC4E2|nr:ROK family transcriptional regulator [Pullulanibacillus sp. KACC 23026]WEG11308.1 ROK family transcriptional regulator [Pullulanibacillus sp. KACC 23026]